MALDTTAAFKIRASVEGQQQLDRFAQSLKNAGTTGEVSAGQIRAAMRTLPAQFTDIATQLAGGQSPFLILMQQGGQIRDSFGGLGNAMRGIAASISPVSLAVAAIGGSIAAFATATYQAVEAGQAFQRTLDNTGNFAGMTADRYEAATQRIREASGASEAAAKGFLAELVKTGQYGPQSLESVATAMATVQRATGMTEKEVSQLFAGMTKSAKDWAYETNKQYNFLDLAQYKYIAQLEEAGRTQDAMRAAADALNGKLADQAKNVTGLAGAWQRAKDKMSEYWTALGSFGNKLVDGESNTDQLDRVRNMIRTKQSALDTGNYAQGSRVYEILTKEIAALREQEGYLQENVRLTRRAADAAAERGAANKQAIEAEREAEKERKSGAGASKVSEFDQLRRGYEDQLLALRDLGASEELLAKIQAGRYKELSKAQQDELLRLTRQIDTRKAEKEAAEEKTRADEKAAREAERLADAEERQRQASIKKWQDIANPAAKYLAQMEEITRLVESGDLTPAEGAAARDWTAEQIMKIGDLKTKHNDAFKDMERAIQGWGTKATDAFVDFAFAGKASFGDLVTSVLKDIARMMLQANVTKPLFNAISSFNWASLFTFAEGGIMTGDGAMPLRKYASGGIANTPQMAMFGEGSMPEAYVPLPDGRTIPVTMKGAGGGGGDTYNISVPVTVDGGGGAEATSGTGAAQLGKAIAAAVRAELINQKRPGGLLTA